MNGYIYILIDTKQVIKYAGKTTVPQKRQKAHENYHGADKRNCKLNCWKFNKRNNGEKIIFEIIDFVDVDVIDYWEKFWISYFKFIGADLLNMTNGGDGMQNPSLETRKKIGLKSIGRKMSNEAKNKRQEKIYNKTGKQVVCFDYNKKFIGEFRNARRASEELNVGYKSISSMCNYSENKCFINGLTFFFKEDKIINLELEKRIKNTLIKKEVIAINAETGEQKHFSSQLEAARVLGVNFRNINMVLKGVRKKCGGYFWKYVN